MEYEYQSSFIRDAKKLPKNIKEGIVEIIDNIQSAEQLSDIEGVTKMVGYSNSYRFKVKSIKDFRIGFFLNEEGVIILSRIVSRKDIYKVFP
jgi:mRNA-degrading endonuclease RelE of RelBE toxin-antitoxin system